MSEHPIYVHEHGRPLPESTGPTEQRTFSGFGLTHREALTWVERSRYRKRKDLLPARDPMRVIADEIWAIAKRLGVSEDGGRLKQLSSSLHDLASKRGVP